jgi:hypothetical protein
MSQTQSFENLDPMTALLRCWILFCAGLVGFGWILSFFGELTPWAYAITLILLGIGEAAYLFKIERPAFKWRQLIKRLLSLRLLLPAIFGISATLLLAKGIVSPPFHDDGLCYRIPRAMNWIMEHRWHWLDAQDPRLDVLGTVSEWLSVPVLVLFRTDQLVFWPNWICHLFLPGLIFSVWRKLGVRPRVAWLSMWLLPTGFCFALQAVNTSNDSLGAFFVLAAFFFALKGNRSEAWSDFAFSILCMALATGVKLNLLSLGLGWAIAVGVGWKQLLSRPARSLGIVLAGALVSFVPTAYLNWSHARGWTGLDYVVSPPPWVNFICTTFQIIVQNLTPPLLTGPFSGPTIIPGLEGTAMGDLMQRGHLLPVIYSQVAIEQAGLGFIVSLAFVLIFLTTRARPTGSPLFSRRFWIFGGITVAFLHYMLFVGSDQAARLISPYYLLLLPALFVGREPRDYLPWYLYKLGVAAAMFAGLYLALFFTENPLANYFPLFYERLYWDERFMEETRLAIPSEEKTVGIIRFYNQRETWLWKPYGSRKVVELPMDPDVNELRRQGIEYVVVSNEMLALNHMTINSWLAQGPWTLVGSVVAGRDNSWYFVKLGK